MSRRVFTDVDLGETKTITVVWTPPGSDTPVDAATTCSLRKPDGVEVDPAPTVDHDATGTYSFTHTYDQSRVWYGELVATVVSGGHTYTAVDPFEVHVNTTPLA